MIIRLDSLLLKEERRHLRSKNAIHHDTQCRCSAKAMNEPMDIVAGEGSVQCPFRLERCECTASLVNSIQVPRFFFFFAMLGVGRGTELIRADFFFLSVYERH